MENIKYSEILFAIQNREIKPPSINDNKIKIISNVTNIQFRNILDYFLFNKKIFLRPELTNFDNAIQDTFSLLESDIPIYFLEPLNFKKSFAFEIELYDDNKYNQFLKSKIDELNLIFDHTKHQKLVIFNSFSHLIISNSSLNINKFESFVNSLNKHLYENAPKNFKIINIDKVIVQLGIEKSYDLKNFYLTQTLYSLNFFKQYINYISPIILSLFSKTKKAIILDCDNTLWGGIIGEDTIIHYNAETINGVIFQEVHYIIKNLINNGIIFGLCSKNNFNDVSKFFEQNNIFIKFKDSVINKINWTDKASNLIEIKNSLNIGLDSIYYVDDSNYEINLITQTLPEIETFKVPENLFEYSLSLLRETSKFYIHKKTSEDTMRISMYNDELKRKEYKNNFVDIDTYINSLNIVIEISINDSKCVDRISQLTTKTNQFNLTTHRYTVHEIQQMFYNDNCDCFTINVNDTFGSYGITGLMIIRYENDKAMIDTFLLSCRIIGRNIEYEFLRNVLNYIQNKKNKIKYITANYFKTEKNIQVADFYDRCSFVCVKNEEYMKSYILENFTFKQKNKITTIWKKD